MNEIQKYGMKEGSKVIAFTEYGVVIDEIERIEHATPAVTLYWFKDFKKTYACDHQIYKWTEDREKKIIANQTIHIG